MKDYKNYKTEDFILDESFRRWVLKNAPKDAGFWEEWAKNHPEKSEIITIARQFVLKMQQAQESLTENEIQQELNRLSEARVTNEIHIAPLLNRISWWKQAVAALVVFSICGMLYYTFQTKWNPPMAYEIRKSQLAEIEQLTEIQNDGTENKKINLPDGSQVTLYPKSRLSFPKVFAAAQREVILSGEAFFNVTKNPKQPFLVYANELVTKVLGTSFTIRAFDKDKEVQVIVKTGKVSVFSGIDAKSKLSNTQQSGVILTPNQQVVFDRSGQNLTKSLISVPVIIAPLPEQKQTLSFEHAAVTTAFETLENVYGVTIVRDDKVLTGCEISAEFDKETLYEQLDLICKAIDAKYEVIDAQIVIHSKGCTPN